MTVTNLKDVKSAGVREELNSLVKQGFICFISGPSGAGKDYVAAKAMSNPQSWQFLDHYGDSSSGKWIISLPKTAKAAVYVGVSDNMEHVVREALQITGAAKAALLLVQPDYDLWVAINKMKAVDYKGSHENWRKGWLDKSKHSAKEHASYFAKKEAMQISHFKRAIGDRQSVVIRVINSQEDVVRKGWHNQKPEANSGQK